MSDPERNTGTPRIEFAEGVFIRSASNSDGERVKALVFGVLAEYGLYPDPEGIDADLDDIEAQYIDSGGAFELLEDTQGTLIGTVGLFPMDETTVELRKMYFAPNLRGRGIGKAALTRMIGLASTMGFSRMVLETASVLKEAIGLYRSYGFKEAPGIHSDRCDRAFYLDL